MAFSAVFPQSVENVVNTRSSMGEKKYLHIPWNRYNLEKYRDINFWSYRPALVKGLFAELPEQLFLQFAHNHSW